MVFDSELSTRMILLERCILYHNWSCLDLWPYKSNQFIFVPKCT